MNRIGRIDRIDTMTTTRLPTAIIAGRSKSSLLILIAVLLGGCALIELARRYHRPLPRRAAAPAAAVMSAEPDTVKIDGAAPSDHLTELAR